MSAPASSQNDSHITCWSLISDLSAPPMDSRSQLNELCRRYETPVKRYIARTGCPESAAKELSQKFFAMLLREGLDRATQYRRFRDFLQAELETFLAHQEELAPCTPDATTLSTSGEASSQARRDLQRGFAQEVMSRATGRLRQEAVDAGRSPLYEQLERYLYREASPDDIQREAKMLDARTLFVSMAIQRLRQRFRQIVDQELTELITDPTELAEERAAMLRALGHSN